MKRGEAGALALLGFGRAPAAAEEDVRLEPPRVAIGAGSQKVLELARAVLPAGGLAARYLK